MENTRRRGIKDGHHEKISKGICHSERRNLSQYDKRGIMDGYFLQVTYYGWTFWAGGVMRKG